ncbi:N-acetyltransferase [soil metagenome]
MTVQDVTARSKPETPTADLRAPAIAQDIVQRETPADAAAVDALVMAAFGPGRYAKTAERLRENAGLAAGFVSREGGRIIGSVRLWHVTVGDVAALFLGPITVGTANRRAGLGADLVAACIAEARIQSMGGQGDAGGGVAGILLVGDAGYFERFGFAEALQARLPGPVDRRRVLWLSIKGSPPEGLVRGAI